MTATEGRPYQGRSAQERKAERRERLIETAIGQYGTRGFRVTTVKDICEAARVTQRYFYEAFTSREDLLCTASAATTNTMREEALLAAAQSGPATSERVWAASLAYFSYIRAHPEVARLTLFEMEGVSAEVDAFHRADLQKTTNLIRDLLFSHSGPAEGSSPRLSPDLLARGILGAMYQMAKEWTHAGFDQTPETMARHLQAIGLGTGRQV
ncbi:TetR/AcrR family transcriptional regulator [Deinococcus phoenicis]|uniref:TetR/AcrR family transcriptional regulator n=1 Tax=Deinococcus phoenicis TaxID=1476583 RepID=UPI0013783E49|nr:TetR/AcrR family transcriptional regulator [Deinococcus phoenicis]